MGRVYSIQPVAFAPGAARTIIDIMAGSAKGIRLRRFWLTSADVAGATVVRVNITRLTANGTGTACTPEPVIMGETAFSGTVKVNDTVEPAAKGNVVWTKQWNILVEMNEKFDEDEAFQADASKGLNIELLDNPAVTITAGAIVEEG